MIYVHVPFCRSFCTYCGFYSEVAPKCRQAAQASRQDELIGAYLTSLETEIAARRNEIDRVFASGDVNTLYIGGGTPSILSLPEFEGLIEAIGRKGYSEFTVEVNPEDIVEKGEDYVKGLLDLGVNRISMGVQSFDDEILKFMNRRHTSAQAVQAYGILEKAGVENISIDLIFGLPQLSEQKWTETINKALNISSTGIPPKHISAYQLSVEPDSMLEKLISKGRFEEASGEQCRKQYELLCEALSRAGYHHYEISNYGQPGYEARHNSAYWRNVPYVGLGPGAHSYIDNRRSWNVSSLESYVKAEDFSRIRESEDLDKEQLAMERVMLGLRTSNGVEEEFLMAHCDRQAVEKAFENGHLLRTDGRRVRIPESSFFISDNIIGSII